MTQRLLGSLGLMLIAVSAAQAQINIYPYPPQPQQPAYAPKLVPPPAMDAPPVVIPAAAQQSPSINWYPNPTAYPIQQVKVDGTPPPAPVPQVVAPAPAPAMPGCDPQAPHMQDVASACGETCGSCDCLCGPPGRVWFGAEYLRWTTKGNPLPPLLTTAPAGTQLAVAGTIGDPATTVLLGGNNANNNWRNGLRIYGGFWFNECQTCGIEANFFTLGQSHYNASIGSNGSQILTRPFTDNVQFDPVGNAVVVAPFPNTELVSFPGIVAGTATVDSTTDFIGGGFNLLCNACCSPCARLDLLLGYRVMQLTDTLTITENLTGLAGSQFPGANFLITDWFRTQNYFQGANAGFNYERRFNRWYVGVRASVALGVTNTTVDINGSTRTTAADGTVFNDAGGLLALPSNIGHYTSSSFSVVPEVGLKAGLQVTDHLRIFGGYNYLYWSNVTRTGGVIDTRVNSSQLPGSGPVVGTAYPQYDPTRTSFYAHGLVAGLELRY